MGVDNFLVELSIVIIIGAIMALVMRILRQPLLIGHILTGIVAGPVLLDLVQPDSALTEFGTFGVCLLLFIVGVEIGPKIFSRLSRTVIWLTLVQIGTVTLAGTLLAQTLGLTGIEAFIVGLALALSSTVIIVTALSKKRETTRLYAQIAIGILLLQDVVATGAKVYLSAYKSSELLTDLLWLGARSLGVVLGIYICAKFILPALARLVGTSKDLLLLFALGWGLGVALLFDVIGLSIEVGALLAGVGIATVPFAHEMAARLKPLRNFFITLFFITLGSTLIPEQLPAIITPVIILSLFVILFKPLVTLISMGLLGYTKRSSFKTAISLSQISEFSLVFVVSAVHSGLASSQTQATISLVALITFALSSYLIKYDNVLYDRLEKHLRLFERKVTRFEQRGALQHYPIVLLGYRKGGSEFIRTFKAMKKRFVMVDYDPEVIELLESQNLHLLYGDITDPELIDELHLFKSKLVVSTISDYDTNIFLAEWLQAHNPDAVFICSAENAVHASELYNTGASYVMMPHFIGSEKMSSFIKRSNLSKTEFKNFREKHLEYLRTHYDAPSPEAV